MKKKYCYIFYFYYLEKDLIHDQLHLDKPVLKLYFRMYQFDTVKNT